MNRNRWRALHEMVERWEQIASQVEQGYPLSFYDYLNDLDLRRSIDEHLREIEDAPDDAIPESTPHSMAESTTIALAAADERFRQATTECAENVWGVANERENQWSVNREWYYYRRPTKWADER